MNFIKFSSLHKRQHRNKSLLDPYSCHFLLSPRAFLSRGIFAVYKPPFLPCIGNGHISLEKYIYNLVKSKKFKTLCDVAGNTNSKILSAQSLYLLHDQMSGPIVFHNSQLNTESVLDSVSFTFEAIVIGHISSFICKKNDRSVTDSLCSARNYTVPGDGDVFSNCGEIFVTNEDSLNRNLNQKRIMINHSNPDKKIQCYIVRHGYYSEGRVTLLRITVDNPPLQLSPSNLIHFIHEVTGTTVLGEDKIDKYPRVFLQLARVSFFFQKLSHGGLPLADNSDSFVEFICDGTFWPLLSDSLAESKKRPVSFADGVWSPTLQSVGI